MIRLATQADIPAIQPLLHQVIELHHKAKPEIFKKETAEGTIAKLRACFENENSRIYVATEEHGKVVGFAICQYRKIKDNPFIENIKYCYLDDLCVDEKYRNQGIGTRLCNYIKQDAKRNGCNALRLNVWALNKEALHFYEKQGLSPLSTIMNQNL